MAVAIRLTVFIFPGYGLWQEPYRSILVSCRVLVLVAQASWFIFMYSIMLPWIMSNHPLLHVSVLSLFFVSDIGNNCLDQFTIGYICHLIDFLPI